MEEWKEFLKVAITGEFNAIRKYQAFSEQATAEGFHNVSVLFKAIAEGEKIHLKNHRRALGMDFDPEVNQVDIGTTENNLRQALDGETEEFKEMYPGFLKAMRRMKGESQAVTKLSMKWAKETEEHHAEILSEALQAVSSGKDYEVTKFWVCKVCGNLEVKDLPDDVCPVCKHDPKFYMEVKT